MGSSVSGSELAAYRVVNRIDRAIDPGHHFFAWAERLLPLTILRARVFDLFYRVALREIHCDGADAFRPPQEIGLAIYDVDLGGALGEGTIRRKKGQRVPFQTRPLNRRRLRARPERFAQCVSHPPRSPKRFHRFCRSRGRACRPA
jgi:hypothetical protein